MTADSSNRSAIFASRSSRSDSHYTDSKSLDAGQVAGMDALKTDISKLVAPLRCLAR